MAEDYFDQMDKFLAPKEENRFLDPSTGSEGAPILAKPSIPIGSLGTTFAEKGTSGQQTMIQSMIASIRRGTGSLQLAIQTDHNAQMFGGISSVSKAQRQAIKEMIQVSGVEWQGLEMPTSSMSEVSGFNPQQKQFSEQKRQRNIQAIKDAIHFNADIGMGGGVDIWSQEFHRDIYSADFNEKQKTNFIDFEGFDENKDANKMLVDKRTGQLYQVNTGALGGSGPKIAVPIWETATENGVGPNGVPYQPGDYLDSVGNKLDANANSQKFIEERVPIWDQKEGKIKTKQMTWKEFKNYANQRNTRENVNLTPEEWAVRMQLETQYEQQKAQIDYYTQRYERELDEIKRLAREKANYEKMEEGKSEQELMAMNLLVPVNPSSHGGQYLQPTYKKKSEIMETSIKELKRSLNHAQTSASQSETQATNTWDAIQNIDRVENYGKQKTADSYAQLGLYAMEETNKHKPLKPIHVGPELGWPTAYGGHPQEFIEIIQDARKEMINKMKNDPYYRSRYSDSQMKELAAKHISGELDTSHLNMWYNHFPKQDPHEPEEKRLKRFNKWYLDQIEALAKAKVIGGVQVVDSITGDHRHLPVGQGLFPVKEAVEVLKKNGYDGSFVSEGHEDEQIDPGSTQFSLWNELGASIGTGYHFGSPRGGNSFGNIYGGIGGGAGYRIPPGYSFGAYSPSEEFKVWSGVPDF